MKPERHFSGQTLGYVSSGRFMADAYFDEAMSLRRLARFCFRAGLVYEGKRDMRAALRAWRNYRHLKAKVLL